MGSERHAAILQAMAGACAQKPMDADTLTGKLADTGLVLLRNELLDELDELVHSRAVNTARVSRDGVHFTGVYWPTGLTPAAFNAFRAPIKSHTEADARAAHEAQAAAEASRSTPSLSPIPSPHKEPDMPRIAKPAKPAQSAKPDVIVEDHSRRKSPAGAVIADAKAAVYGLSESTAMRADDLFPHCPAAGSLNSLKATLRSLAAKKEIGVVYRMERGHLLAHYHGLAAPALNDGHEQNLETIRRLASDDHPPGAGASTEPDAVSACAEALNLDAPGTSRFALWDDGQLLLTMGDDMMVLDAGSTLRLADFLDSVMGL